MIALLVNSLTSGGAEKVVLTLLQNFRKSTDQISLYCIEKEQFYSPPSSIPTHYLTKFETLEKSWLNIIYLLLSAYRLKQEVKEKNIQVVQSHLPRASFINVLARLMGARHHAQIVIHSRLNFEHKVWPIRWLERSLYQQLFNRADSIISICELMRQEANSYLRLSQHPQHQVIYNPHQLEEIRRKAKERIEDFNFLSDHRYIVCVGRMVKRKGLDHLVVAFQEVLRKHPHTKLLFIGDGAEKAAVEQQVNTLNIHKAVVFLGYQSNPYAFIARADILVLASETEGLPNILIEALACGTPVISSDCISGPREILSPHTDLTHQLSDQLEEGTYGLLFPVGNIDLLAQGINRLLEDQALWKGYRQRADQRARDFDATVIAQQYLQTFPQAQTHQWA
ncbi:MAG: glycosyltransferase [Bacteroidota bacterium]